MIKIQETMEEMEEMSTDSADNGKHEERKEDTEGRSTDSNHTVTQSVHLEEAEVRSILIQREQVSRSHTPEYVSMRCPYFRILIFFF